MGAKSKNPEGVGSRRHYTPEERRGAIEAYQKSGLDKQSFARTFGVSAFTLHHWLRAYERGGPKGLERLSPGPAKRRGKAPLAEPVRQEVVAVKRRFPAFGLRRVAQWVFRFSGLKVSPSSVRNVVRAEGLPPTPVVRRRRRRRQKAAAPKTSSPPCYATGPNELWQSDITYVDVPWSRKSLYLVAFLDDHSRYVVSAGLHVHQKAEIVLECLQEGISKYGRPKEVLTDQGRQYFAWRGKCDFQKRLRLEGIQHVVARAHHPQTVGKCERLWKTLQDELWSRVMLRDLEDARERLKRWLEHYNFQRPHQGLEGMTPADRYFGVEDAVRQALEREVAKNALKLALGEAPRKPVFLVGQIDGQSVSLHGEGGRVVVQMPGGEVKEIEARDLGVGKKEVSDESGDDERDDDGAGVLAGRGPEGPAPGAPGAQAHAVPGSQGDADPASGALGGGEPGAAGGGAPDGGGGASDVAGPEPS